MAEIREAMDELAPPGDAVALPAPRGTRGHEQPAYEMRNLEESTKLVLGLF